MFLYVSIWAVHIGVSSCFALLILFFAISKKDKNIKAFIPLLIFMFIWSLAALLMKLQAYPDELFWNKIMVGALCFVPFCIYSFILIFSGLMSFRRILPWIIATIPLVILDFMGLIVTSAKIVLTPIHPGSSLNIVELSYTLGWGAIVTYSLLFLMLISIVIKVRIFVKQDYLTYKRISPIITGVYLMFIGQLLNVLPIGKYPVDLLMGFINAILIIYAIYKQRMLELKFVFTRGIMYSIVTVALTMGYVALVLRLQSVAQSMSSPVLPYVTAIMALAIALLFQPLYVLTKKIIDKIFYKTEYTHRNALKEFNVNISNRLDLSEITDELIEAIKKGIGANKVHLMLKSDDGENFYCYKSQTSFEKPESQLSKDNPIVKWFETNNECITKETLNYVPMFKAMWERERRELSDLGIEVIVPIKCRGLLTGIMLISEKTSDYSYTLEDLDLLTSLGASTAVAIDNARLFNLAQKEAMTDDLTKLYNHRYFHKNLKKLVEEAKNSEISLVLMDIDMFKLYNDLYGHIEGDRALVKIADIILNEAEGHGTIARYSGGKFAIILPFFDSNRALNLSEKIRKRVQENFLCSEDSIQRFLTVSVGICTYPHTAANQDDLLTRADIALYKAKNNGKNQSVIYSQNTMAPHEESLAASLSYGGSRSTTVYALTAAIDAKDHFTFGHSQNVAVYAAILAEQLGLDAAHIDIIREAALLHDIGKIGIPEYILTKPGRLEHHEYEMLKRHVEMSITIVKHLPSLNHVVPLIIAHHERWDGKGYPRGLSGESIPIGARCLSVADSFDAITSHRPYKAAMPVEFALREIEMQMGKQFDPEISRIFVDLVRSGKIKIPRPA